MARSWEFQRAAKAVPEHLDLLANEPPRIELAQFLKGVKQMTTRKLRGRREEF